MLSSAVLKIQGYEIFPWETDTSTDVGYACVYAAGMKKPAGTAEEIEKHFGCESSQLIMVNNNLVVFIFYYLIVF